MRKILVKLASLLSLVVFLSGCSADPQSYFEGNKYFNKKFGISINKPDDWTFSEDKIAFFVLYRVVFRDEYDHNMIMFSKVPFSKNTLKNLDVAYQEVFREKMISMIKKGPRINSLDIEKEEKTELNGVPAYLMQVTYEYSTWQFQMGNYLVEHNGELYNVMYRVRRDKDFQTSLSIIKSSLDSLAFL